MATNFVARVIVTALLFLSSPQQAKRLAKRFVVSEEKHAVSLLVKEEWLP